MGYAAAYEWASVLDLDTAIRTHLSGNCYPPIPSQMWPICVDAVKACASGESDTELDLPVGVSYKDKDTAPAWAVVDNFRLDAFVDYLDAQSEGGMNDGS